MTKKKNINIMHFESKINQLYRGLQVKKKISKWWDLGNDTLGLSDQTWW